MKMRRCGPESVMVLVELWFHIQGLLPAQAKWPKNSLLYVKLKVQGSLSNEKSLIYHLK